MNENKMGKYISPSNEELLENAGINREEVSRMIIGEEIDKFEKMINEYVNLKSMYLETKNDKYKIEMVSLEQEIITMADKLDSETQVKDHRFTHHANRYLKLSENIPNALN